MATNPDEHRDVVTTLSKSNVFRRQYSEEDITALEGADLTDGLVAAALDTAYRQNDPAEAEFVGFRRDPWVGVHGPYDRLSAMLGAVENDLRTEPRDYALRARRLAILTHMACLQNRESPTKATGHAIMRPRNSSEPLREST